MQGPDVSELLVEGTQIWTWRMLSSWAGDLEMVCGEDKGDIKEGAGTCTEQVTEYKWLKCIIRTQS